MDDFYEMKKFKEAHRESIKRRIRAEAIAPQANRVELDGSTKLKQTHDLGKAYPIGYWVEAKVIGGGWTEPVSKQRQIENLTELFTRLLIHTANKEKDPLGFISEFLGENFKIWH